MIFPHPDMEDWNNRDHIKWPWKTMNDDGTYSWQSIWKNGSLEYLYQKETWYGCISLGKKIQYL